ncbi:MAG: hypothetical protein CM1200mP34_5630 [Verrucomicrobiales bacterium]|nr:MAG: hypothetical protein CM1200mP34_5630 [Verrucomicrobiales bacterium]
MNGNKGKRVDVHAFARLKNGNTSIVESGVGRIIEVDKNGKIIHEIPMKRDGRQNTRWVRFTPEGNYLVTSENPGVVTEYNRKGEIVWEYLINTRCYGAIRLKNGNTLIASGSGKSVVEVTPEKKVVWEIKGTVPGTEIELGWMTALQQLKNGNFISAISTPARATRKSSRSPATKKSSGNSTNGSWSATAWPCGKSSTTNNPSTSAGNWPSWVSDEDRDCCPICPGLGLIICGRLGQPSLPAVGCAEQGKE